MTKHTEIPYEVYIGHDNKFIDNPYIIAKDGSATKAPTDICQVFWHGNKSGSTALANARFIVKACNNHDKLVEALKLTVEITRIARKYFPKSIQNSDRFTLENTCAAINKALSELDKDGE
jgi:hypothetical protein